MAINPAELFLDNSQVEASIDLPTFIKRYVQYVLVSADAYTFPVDLEKVFQRYNLTLRKAPLPGQRGAVTEDLQIFVNSNDKSEIRRYSQGHELIEILITAIKENDRGWLDDTQIADLFDNKEDWCERGAAEFVMPMALFYPLVQDYGISLRSAFSLSQKGRASLIATIRQMIKTNLRVCTLVFWHLAHKPSEDVPSSKEQMTFWNMDPPKKLRVRKAYCSDEIGYVRQHKSIEFDTHIGQALGSLPSSLFSGYDYLEITSNPGSYWVEAMPTRYTGEDGVLSLVFFDNEESS